jgi:hypothetical protein
MLFYHDASCLWPYVAVPNLTAQVGRTLRELDLSHNANSTITGPWDCPVLEKLNLRTRRVQE